MFHWLSDSSTSRFDHTQCPSAYKKIIYEVLNLCTLYMSEEQQDRVIDRLAGNLVTCIKDQDGNHVSSVQTVFLCAHTAITKRSYKTDRHRHPAYWFLASFTTEPQTFAKTLALSSSSPC